MLEDQKLCTHAFLSLVANLLVASTRFRYYYYDNTTYGNLPHAIFVLILKPAVLSQ